MIIKLIQPKTMMRPMDPRLKTRMFLSLALLTIANMFHKEHTVIIENENIEDINFDEMAISGCESLFIGFESLNEDAIKNKIEMVTSHILTPYPRTKVYDEFVKNGRITDFDFSKYNTTNVVFKPKNYVK